MRMARGFFVPALVAIMAMAAGAGLTGCASVEDRDTLADLHAVEPDLDDVRVADSLERAEQSYRRYLDETPSTAMTPEAMRRLADLQIEKEFGVIGTGELVEVAAGEDMEPPQRAERSRTPADTASGEAAAC